MKPILIPVILDSCSVKKDKSASIRMTTQLELTKEQYGNFFDNNGLQGIMYFRAADELEKDEIEKLDSVDVDLYEPKKSQSKRLRDVLYVWQTQILGRKPTEEERREFYFTQTEKIINNIKEKLD